jgi:hypothetical protein
MSNPFSSSKNEKKQKEWVERQKNTELFFLALHPQSPMFSSCAFWWFKKTLMVVNATIVHSKIFHFVFLMADMYGVCNWSDFKSLNAMSDCLIWIQAGLAHGINRHLKSSYRWVNTRLLHAQANMQIKEIAYPFRVFLHEILLKGYRHEMGLVEKYNDR